MQKPTIATLVSQMALLRSMFAQAIQNGLHVQRSIIETQYNILEWMCRSIYRKGTVGSVASNPDAAIIRGQEGVDKADLELTPIVPIVKYLEPPASAQPEEEEEDPALIFKERTGTDCETQTEIPYPVFPSVEVTEEELMKPTFWPKTSNQETRDRLLLQMEYLRRGFRKAKENGAKKYTFLMEEQFTHLKNTLVEKYGENMGYEIECLEPIVNTDPDDDFQPDNIRVVGEQFEKDTQTDLSLLTSPPIESNSSSLQADNVLAVEEQDSNPSPPVESISSSLQADDVLTVEEQDSNPSPSIASNSSFLQADQDVLFIRGQKATIRAPTKPPRQKQHCYFGDCKGTEIIHLSRHLRNLHKLSEHQIAAYKQRNKSKKARVTNPTKMCPVPSCKKTATRLGRHLVTSHGFKIGSEEYQTLLKRAKAMKKDAPDVTMGSDDGDESEKEEKDEEEEAEGEKEQKKEMKEDE